MISRQKRKNYAKLVNLLDKKLTNPGFIEQFKGKPQDFTRKRSFSFKSLSLFIVSSLQSSIQRELDRFFQSYNDKEVAERFVTQSAFSQARNKIRPEAFEELNKESVRCFYSEFKLKKWNGFRLVAIDGSEIQLPKNPGTIAEYGEYKTSRMDSSVVLARISKSYDVLNNISIDAKLVNRKVGERSLAKSHLGNIGKNDLFLLDRGYPSFDLFREILSRGGHFCARIAVGKWNIAKELVETGETEKIALIRPGYSIRTRYKGQNIEVTPIKCRFILIELENGEKEVLITSLLNKGKYPHGIFKGLYHKRWGIEESYKKDKVVLQFENFSGYSVIAVRQDFFATILLGNLTAIMASGLDGEIGAATAKAKYDYQINITNALSKIKHAIAKLFTKARIDKMIEQLLGAILANIQPIRPNRSFKRRDKKKHRNHIRYYKSYMAL